MREVRCRPRDLTEGGGPGEKEENGRKRQGERSGVQWRAQSHTCEDWILLASDCDILPPLLPPPVALLVEEEGMLLISLADCVCSGISMYFWLLLDFR